jgi:hypothetical protein
MKDNYTLNSQEFESAMKAFKEIKRGKSRFFFAIGVILTLWLVFLIYTKILALLFYILVYLAVFGMLFYLSVVILGKNIKHLQDGNYKCTLTTFLKKKTQENRGGKMIYIVTNEFPDLEVKSIDVQHGDSAILGDEIIILQILNRKYALVKRLCKG